MNQTIKVLPKYASFIVLQANYYFLVIMIMCDETVLGLFCCGSFNVVISYIMLLCNNGEFYVCLVVVPLIVLMSMSIVCVYLDGARASKITSAKSSSSSQSKCGFI